VALVIVLSLGACRLVLDRSLNRGEVRGQAVVNEGGSFKGVRGATARVENGPSSRTDAAGRFVLKTSGLGAKVAISITADLTGDGTPDGGLRIRDVDARGGVDLGRLVLGAFSVLEGIASSNGVPVANATVVLDDGRTTTTDADGRFHFDDVIPGEHDVTAAGTRNDGALLVGRGVAAVGVAATVELEVQLDHTPEPGRLGGDARVLDRDPGPGIRVTLSRGTDVRNYVTDAAGVFGNELLPGGLWRVVARESAEGPIGLEIPAVLVDGAATPVLHLVLTTVDCSDCIVDRDRDGVDDATDLCPDDFDPAQQDADGDTLGDACDDCPGAAECTCEPGAVRCVGLRRGTCVAPGVWDDGESCAFTCRDGACAGVCVPGTRACDGSTPMECDTSGRWATESSCIGQTCLAGACIGDCAAGSLGCDGNTTRRCEPDGTWTSLASCPEQACWEGACAGTCEPGERRCSGNTIATCGPDGTWRLAPERCVDQACIDGACVGECEPGTTSCLDRTPASCDASGTILPAGLACAHRTCVNGACIGPCDTHYVLVGADCIPAIPNAAITPLTVDLNTAATSADRFQVVTLTNDGHGPLQVLSIALQAGTPAEFVLSGVPALPAALGIGASIAVTVRCDPARVQPQDTALAGPLRLVPGDPETPTVTLPIGGTCGIAFAGTDIDADGIADACDQCLLDGPTPPVVATVVSDSGWNYTLSNPSINGGGNTANLTPGATYTIAVDYAFGGPYCGACPGCVTQWYLNADPASIDCVVPLMFCSSPTFTGRRTNTWRAPSKPGTYWIGASFTWDFRCYSALAPHGQAGAVAAICVRP